MSDKEFNFDNEKKIFLLQDPTVNISKSDIFEGLKLNVSYPFSGELLVAFVFQYIKEKDIFLQEAYYINSEFTIKFVNYKKHMVEMFIKHKKMIYNGSFYNLIN